MKHRFSAIATLTAAPYATICTFAADTPAAANGEALALPAARFEGDREDRKRGTDRGVVQKDPHNPLFKEAKPREPRFDNPYCSVLYDAEENLYKCATRPSNRISVAARSGSHPTVAMTPPTIHPRILSCYARQCARTDRVHAQTVPTIPAKCWQPNSQS